MGISRITAIQIQSRDDIVVSSGGPTANNKYVGWITLGPDDSYRPLLSTADNFDSPDSAEQHMKDLVAKIRDTKI